MNVEKYIGKKVLNPQGARFEAGDGDYYDGRDSAFTENHAFFSVELCDRKFADKIGCDFFSLNVYFDNAEIIRGVVRVSHQHFHNGEGYDQKLEKFSLKLEDEADEVLQYMVS